ncbi:hypothetical protein [Lysobacter auxotrophicus]|uniref:Integron gene cassette protein n=1 Tax=Lysobacter auxotrophicus TaxID=2992573 RepID=A0ABN6UP44_9GAMM|nr:hypothetical protein [Lysobacter auxotrophicus]BDU16648.1 hypothetical protein LA521A_18490 [Lysobacter auxotrophicus]
MDIGLPSLLSIALLMLAIATTSWIWFWRRHANPARRIGACVGGFGCLLFAAFPGLWVLEAMGTGYLPCIWRRRPVDAFSAADTPAAFWGSVILLSSVAALFLGGFMHGVSRMLVRRDSHG